MSMALVITTIKHWEADDTDNRPSDLRLIYKEILGQTTEKLRTKCDLEKA